jgi:hypothetical protein
VRRRQCRHFCSRRLLGHRRLLLLRCLLLHLRCLLLASRYISRRILTDPSPRTAAALETFVFGGAREDAGARVLDADRVATLVDGARRYAAAASLLEAEGEGPPAAAATAASTASSASSATAATAAATVTAPAARAADALLDLLAEDTPASRLLIEQLVLVSGAATRQRWSELRAASGRLQPDRSRLGAIVDPLGLFRASPLVANDARDEAALRAADKLAALAAQLLAEAPPAGGAAPAVDRQELVRALVGKAYERRDDLRRVSRRIAVEALDQAALRLVRQGREAIEL